MDNRNLNKLKNLYDKGYKCIRYDENNDEFTAYLKNFELEKSKEIRSYSKKEFDLLKSFIDNESLQ